MGQSESCAQCGQADARLPTRQHWFCTTACRRRWERERDPRLVSEHTQLHRRAALARMRASDRLSTESSSGEYHPVKN